MTPSGRNQFRVECERLLLVEGRDESNLFDALKTHCLGDLAPMVQVVEAGGRTRFQSRILAILKDATKRGVALRALGVVRDADTDGGAAWASVRDAVGKAGLQAPGRHGDFSDGPPDVGILIIPDAQGRGALETLCVRSLAETPAGDCVERYLTCLADSDVLASTNRDKSFAHAWLAGGPDPVARVGEGAKQGRWNFDHPAFASLVRFVERLAERGA